jgi:fibro-slime domain-containing protein
VTRAISKTLVVGALLATAGCAFRPAGTRPSGDGTTSEPPDAGPPPLEDARLLDVGPINRPPDDVTATPDAACAHEIKAVVRDFRGYDSAAGPRHPDFEGNFVAYQGIVQAILGADQKPVYCCTGATPATTGPTEFDQWYRDVSGINLRFDDIVLPLTEDPAHAGSFVYDNQMFFPIDGRGWMDLPFATHNYHFTTEIHLQFPYRGGEVFTFRGDDDVFVFINARLAIDLGGVHPAEMGSVDLDAQAAALGIVRGKTYNLDIFQAERHTTESTFRLETTLQCITSYVVP